MHRYELTGKAIEMYSCWKMGSLQKLYLAFSAAGCFDRNLSKKIDALEEKVASKFEKETGIHPFDIKK